MYRKKILYLLISFFLVIQTLTGYSQPLDSISLAAKPIFTSLDEALKTPNEVYRLHLRKQKLKKLPIEVFKFNNLQDLDISKNKLTELPSGIENLPNLVLFDASSNNLTTIPAEIGQCIYLKKLVLNRNYIEELPSTMANLIHLEYLDLWSNSIIEFPQAMDKLAETLKELDLRVINMNDERQEAIRTLLPKTTIYFSRSCNCN
jgi:Leucine-rich repeat (LRR) protein